MSEQDLGDATDRRARRGGGRRPERVAVLALLALVGSVLLAAEPGTASQGKTVSATFPTLTASKWSLEPGCTDGGWIEVDFLDDGSLSFFYGNSVELLEITSFDGVRFTGFDETGGKTWGTIDSDQIAITAENSRQSATYFRCER